MACHYELLPSSFRVMNLMSQKIGLYWVVGIAVLMMGGCAPERGGKELVGNWLEDLPPKLNETERNRSALTLTPDGWFRVGRWMGTDGHVDRATVQETQYEVKTTPDGKKEYAVVTGFAMIRDGERLRVQGLGAPSFFRRTKAEVPTTRPIGK